MIVPILTAALASVAPSSAAIGCVEQTLSAVDRAAIVRSADEMAGGKQDARLPDPLQTAVDKAAAACGKQHGWNARMIEAADMYALATVAIRSVDAAIRTGGNDPARWAQVFRALPEETRVGVSLAKDDSITAYTAQLEKAGAKLDTAGFRLAGLLAAMLFLQDESLARFAAR